MNKALEQIKYWLLLTLMVVGSFAVSFAANDDEETDDVAVRLLGQTMKENLSLEDDVKTLNQRVKDWNDSIKAYEKKLKNANNKLKQQQQQIDKIQPQKNQDDEAALEKRQQRLQSERERLKEQNAELQREIDDLNHNWDEKSRNLKELESIQQGMAMDFVNENEPYLEQAFSKMSMPKLHQLQEKCGVYQGNHIVDAFSEKLENVIRQKETIDTANAVVNRSFDRNAVTKADRSLSQLNNLTEAQANEVTLLRQQLAGFEKGLKAFKAYIDDFDSRRESITSAKYVKTEVGFVEENMGDRIENEIKAVPYLKTTFEMYKKAILAKPLEKSDAEKAILKQYNNIKQ